MSSRGKEKAVAIAPGGEGSLLRLSTGEKSAKEDEKKGKTDKRKGGRGVLTPKGTGKKSVPLTRGGEGLRKDRANFWGGEIPNWGGKEYRFQKKVSARNIFIRWGGVREYPLRCEGRLSLEKPLMRGGRRPVSRRKKKLSWASREAERRKSFMCSQIEKKLRTSGKKRGSSPTPVFSARCNAIQGGGSENRVSRGKREGRVYSS